MQLIKVKIPIGGPTSKDKQFLNSLAELMADAYEIEVSVVKPKGALVWHTIQFDSGGSPRESTAAKAFLGFAQRVGWKAEVAGRL